MNIETNKQQYQQQQQQQQQDKVKHQQHQKQQYQQQQQHQHHAHCSYDKDIVCDDTQMHKQQQQQQSKHQHHSHQPHAQSSSHCEQKKNRSNENIQPSQHQQPSSAYQQQRSKDQEESSFSHRHQHQHQQQSQSQPQTQRSKYSHSHSPHHSRHTSPHSHHSHSLHSSPHQSHQHVNGSTVGSGGSGGLVDTLDTRHSSSLRPSTQSSSSRAHHHHHHHYRRRNRRNNHNHGTGNGNGNGSGGGSGGGSGNSSLHGPHGHSHNSQQERSSGGGSRQHSNSCTRRHRSATDISSVSLNTCHNENCIDREVQEIFVRKSCCSSSRTELAQYFAEDLYGSSRRPSSCCTSSDYCYQTDSTSLYGSRSSLSRNNSIKSASISMRKKHALHQRQPSYTSISLRGIQATSQSTPNQRQSTVFDRQKSKSTELKHGGGSGSGGGGGSRVILSPSKVTIERQTSKERAPSCQELPAYASSPIRWSLLSDDKMQTEDCPQKPPLPKKPCRQSKQVESGQQLVTKVVEQRPSSKTTATTTTAQGTMRKRRESAYSCEFEESSTTVLFHQEGEAYNNCCNNYIQCNSYLDQDLQITSEDIHQYLSKGNHSGGGGDILNNSKNYPFQPSNALEFHYKNNFANNNTTPGSGTGTGTGTNCTAESSEGAESVLAANDPRFNFNRYRHNSSKETNLNQNMSESGGPSAIITTQPANINLSSSTNNINITIQERTANEVKFINTTASSRCETMSTDIRLTDYRLPYDCANVSSKSYFDKPLGIDELPKEFDAASCSTKTTAAALAECSGAECSSSDGQRSITPLPSPVQTGVSFESFDAPSDHNLISQRGSCQFSSPTPRSPLSPSSPACSSLSASVNAGGPSTFVVEPTQHHQSYNCSYSYSEQEQRQHQHQSQSQTRGHHHHHHYHHHHQHSSPASTTQRGATTHHHAHHSYHQSETDDCSYNHHHHHHHSSQNTNDSFRLSNAFKKVRKRARNFLRKK